MERQIVQQLAAQLCIYILAPLDCGGSMVSQFGASLESPYELLTPTLITGRMYRMLQKK
jgi:hypothetical protein